VGIGTFPEARLDVNGNSYFRGQLNLAPFDAYLNARVIQNNAGWPDSSLYIGYNNAAGSDIYFYGQGTTAQLFLRGPTGNFGIGTTNATNILTVKQSSGTDPIADAWTIYSSARWKTNVQTIAGALDQVQRLRGVSFDWKADGTHDIGLIAEEVGQVVPEVVAYEENGKDAKSVDYARLVAVLIEAVKEQHSQIGELKVEVEGLKGKIRLAELSWPAK
jgi:hypothetical protein